MLVITLQMPKAELISRAGLESVVYLIINKIIIVEYVCLSNFLESYLKIINNIIFLKYIVLNSCLLNHFK